MTEDSEKDFPPPAYELDEKTKAGLEKLHSEVSIIPADSKVSEFMPPFLKEFSKKAVVDWNYCTIEQTLKRFEQLCPEHRKFDSYRFWNALIRGGIQGVLYVADIE